MSDFVDVGGRLYLVEVAELSSGEPFEVDHAAGAIKISAAVPIGTRSNCATATKVANSTRGSSFSKR
jgi:hypothetical protein